MSRLDAFKALLDEYQANASDYDEGEEEDPRPYLDGSEELSQYVCVTVNYSSHGYEKPFFLPTFESLQEAQERAVEYANDDIFEELPREIRDLDSGESWTPLWQSVQWRQWQPIEKTS